MRDPQPPTLPGYEPVGPYYHDDDPDGQEAVRALYHDQFEMGADPDEIDVVLVCTQYGRARTWDGDVNGTNFDGQPPPDTWVMRRAEGREVPAPEPQAAADLRAALDDLRDALDACMEAMPGRIARLGDEHDARPYRYDLAGWAGDETTTRVLEFDGVSDPWRGPYHLADLYALALAWCFAEAARRGWDLEVTCYALGGGVAHYGARVTFPTPNGERPSAWVGTDASSPAVAALNALARAAAPGA